MIRKWAGIPFLLLLLLASGCGEDELEVDGNISGPDGSGSISQMVFKNVQEAHQQPSKVQFIFSLRDQNDHAVLIPQAEFDDKVEVIIEEDSQPIDYTESHGFIHTAENFAMDVVLVLDFTESMARSAGGIDTMLLGAQALIEKMGESHRICVVEFHNNEPGDNFSVLQPFTTVKEAAQKAIDDFVMEGAYHGFSTCWDAVLLGLTQFEMDSDPNKVRALAFLSDGFDNSSDVGTDSLKNYAIEREIRIYNIGVGSIDSDKEAVLKDISSATGGNYYPSEDITLLKKRFDQIINDMGGNYKISYITPRNKEFKVSIVLKYGGLTTDPPITGSINGAAIDGSDKLGLILFGQSVIRNQKAEVYVRADHIPRDVTAFRFMLVTDKDYVVSIVPASSGGLLENWSELVLDSKGYLYTEGPELEFGDFGLLFKIVFSDITEAWMEIPVSLDNSIYDFGVAFYSGDGNEFDADGNWQTKITLGELP